MQTELRAWADVTKQFACPICGKTSRCQVTGDGAIRCFRIDIAPPGHWVVRICKDNTKIFRRSNSVGDSGRVFPVAGACVTGPPALLGFESNLSKDLAVLASQFESALTDKACAALAKLLGVTPAALRAIGCGSDGRAYTFPERNGFGKIIGIGTRRPDGSKRFRTGGKRGLTIPLGISTWTGPTLIVEGPSDVAACWSLGIPAVGRPSNRGGIDHLVSACERVDVLIVGENDERMGESGVVRSPGRDGALTVATALAARLQRSISWTMPPTGAKDIRQWLRARPMDFGDECSVADARRDLLQMLIAGVNTVECEK